ncbi:MAG: transposase [Thermoplasmata archaeon]|nr:transposase [Thermoplasmata archaeon]
MTIRFGDPREESPLVGETPALAADAESLAEESEPQTGEDVGVPQDDPTGCPSEPHLHVTLNRRLGMNFFFMDVGHQLLTGKGPWSLFSHCPECGKLVEDRSGRHFRCDTDNCDSRWDVPREQVRAAREIALRTPDGEEAVILTEAEG